MTYFVAKKKHASEPYRVVFQEVKTRTSKGYPLTYELKPLPEEYATWEEAYAASERLNDKLGLSGRSSGVCPFFF
jgi:hypothetical protein